MGVMIFGSGGGAGSNGPDLSADTIQDRYVLNPYTFHDHEGNAGVGTIYNWDGTILAGPSSDGNKMTVSPSSSTRHIVAGSYLNREIELAAMPAGSTALSQSGDIVTLTKQAGYIDAGTQQLTVSAGSTSLSRSGATVNLTRQAGYVTAGTDSLTVPLSTKTVNITVNGATTVTPPSGYVGLSSVTVNTSVAGSTPVLQNRSVTINSNGTQTFYKTSSAYDGLYSLTVTTAVSAPSKSVYFGGASANSLSGKSVTISGTSTMQMVALMSSSTANNVIVSAFAWRNSNDVYFYVNGGPGRGLATASWTANSVTLNFSDSNYSLSGFYRIVYAYLA